MFKLVFKSSIRKDIRKIDKHKLREIAQAVNSLKSNPLPESANKIKGGNEPYYRIRQGAYRIGYRINSDIKAVEVVFIKIRNEKTYR